MCGPNSHLWARPTPACWEGITLRNWRGGQEVVCIKEAKKGLDSEAFVLFQMFSKLWYVHFLLIVLMFFMELNNQISCFLESKFWIIYHYILLFII